MPNAADALQAHSLCKARLIALLKGEDGTSSEEREFCIGENCALHRFIAENDGADSCAAKIAQLKRAHAGVQAVVSELAAMHADGQPIDWESLFARDSPLAKASAACIGAIWRLESELNSLES